MSTVISVENVSKAYRLGLIGGGTLKEDFARWWAQLQGKPDPNLKIGQEHHTRKMGEQFWALDDVSFDGQGGRDSRHHRTQRRRQKHTAENPLAGHRNPRPARSR